MFFYCGLNDLEITLGNILTFAILFTGHGISHSDYLYSFFWYFIIDVGAAQVVGRGTQARKALLYIYCEINMETSFLFADMTKALIGLRVQQQAGRKLAKRHQQRFSIMQLERQQLAIFCLPSLYVSGFRFSTRQPV